MYRKSDGISSLYLLHPPSLYESSPDFKTLFIFPPLSYGIPYPPLDDV